MFARAEELDHHLNQMESTLKKIVHDYNTPRGGASGSAGGAGGGGSGSGSGSGVDDRSDGSFSLAGSEGNPAAKIVAVLNSHHDTLALLDARSRQLQQELLTVSRDIRMAPMSY